MKPIYEYLINKQTKNKYKYHPKTVSELEKIILQEMEIQETYECDLNCIDTSEVTVMGWLFQSIPELRKFNGNISEWDVSKVRNMYMMFCDSDFDGKNSDLRNWDVRNVVNMGSMFSNTMFDGDISTWQTDSLESCSSMFYFNRKWDGDLSKWNMSKVKSMQSMFEKTSFTGTKGDIGNWDVSNCEEFDRMFEQSSFSGDLSNWDIKSAKSIDNMFVDCNLKRYPKWYKPRTIKNRQRP